MIIVEINDKEYNLPKSWNEVSIEMFEKIMKQASILSTYKSQVLYSLEMFSILCGAPIDELKEMNRESFDKMGDLCNWVNDEIEPSGVSSWTIEGTEYKAVSNMNALTMGDNISLEIMINESDEANILGNILPILIRKTKQVTKEDGSVKVSITDFDAENYNETRDLFKKNLNVADVFQLKSFF
jgi:hypothetical protein